MAAKRAPLEKLLVGPAGEHYVLSHLYRRGIMASLAPPGAPNIDILAIDERETITATIQVKARTRGRDLGWPLNQKHEEIKHPRLFYAFVDFEPEHPVTYTVPSGVVAKLVKDSHQAWLKIPGRGGRPHKDNPMRRVQAEHGFKVPGFESGWIEKYREQWDALHS